MTDKHMSTAQGHMNDKLRNEGLPVPKEADTAEPMSVEERTRRIDERLKTNPRGLEFEFVAEQIRQAEQAAYERAANVAEFKWRSRLIAEAIRALAQKPEEVG